METLKNLLHRLKNLETQIRWVFHFGQIYFSKSKWIFPEFSPWSIPWKFNWVSTSCIPSICIENNAAREYNSADANNSTATEATSETNTSTNSYGSCGKHWSLLEGLFSSFIHITERYLLDHVLGIYLEKKIRVLPKIFIFWLFERN